MSDEKKTPSKNLAPAPKNPVQQVLPGLAKQPRQHYTAGLSIYRMKGDRRDRVSSASIMFEQASGETRGYFTKASIALSEAKKAEDPDFAMIKTLEIQVRSQFTLGAQELRVMHAILGHVTTENRDKVMMIALEPTSERGRDLAESLGYKPHRPLRDVPPVVNKLLPFLENPTTLRIETSYRELLATCGMSFSGQNIKTVAGAVAALELAMVRFAVVYQTKDGEERSFISDLRPLIKTKLSAANRAPGQYTESMLISLDPHIIRSVSSPGAHRIIDLDEVRAIKREATLLLHNYLCGYIDRGETRRVRLGTMVDAIYPPESKPASKETIRKRRSTIRVVAIKDLIRLGWKFEEYRSPGSDVGFKVKRPLGDREKPQALLPASPYVGDLTE